MAYTKNIEIEAVLEELIISLKLSDPYKIGLVQ
jgi:hypothetical protein